MSAVLAVEWSSRRLGVCLECDGNRWERVAEMDRFRAPEAMALLDALAAESPEAWSGIAEIRIGRGPGNYTGVRQAFAWAAGMAAPGGIRVTARSSGRAQAVRLLRGRECVWILGDARRGMWWGCRFPRGEAPGEWILDTPEAWRGRIGKEAVVSAEAGRLNGLDGVLEDFPRAVDLLDAAELAEELPEPIYLHPPVS